MISIQNLSVEFNSTALFSGVNFVINKRDKIALVGKNGAGKSTMLKIIAPGADRRCRRRAKRHYNRLSPAANDSD